MSEANKDAVADGDKRTGTLNQADLARIMDVKVEVTVELGRRRLRRGGGRHGQGDGQQGGRHHGASPVSVASLCSKGPTTSVTRTP